MKAPFVIYADFECLLRKIQGCEPQSGSYAVKTEKHESCGFAYTIVRSNGETLGPINYRGKIPLCVPCRHITKRKLAKSEDWQKRDTRTLPTATFATKISSRICSWTTFLCITTTPVDIVAKATEDATTRHWEK